jgi:hypothetical protein
MKTHLCNPNATCPYCGHCHEAATDLVHHDQKPSAGDFTVCIECANILVFTDTLETKKPNNEELKCAQNIPELMKYISVRTAQLKFN